MAIYADDAQSLERRCMLVNTQRVNMGYAKFVAFQTRRDVWVCFRVDVGVDANADRGCQAHAERNARQHVQLGFTFNIEATDASFQGLTHLSAGFAYARKNNLCQLAIDCNDPLQLAARHNIKAAASLGKHLQNSQRRIGLHGIANLRVATSKAALVCRQGTEHGGF